MSPHEPQGERERGRERESQGGRDRGNARHSSIGQPACTCQIGACTCEIAGAHFQDPNRFVPRSQSRDSRDEFQIPNSTLDVYQPIAFGDQHNRIWQILTKQVNKILNTCNMLRKMGRLSSIGQSACTCQIGACTSEIAGARFQDPNLNLSFQSRKAGMILQT